MLTYAPNNQTVSMVEFTSHSALITKSYNCNSKVIKLFLN